MAGLDVEIKKIGLVPLHESFKSCSDESIKDIENEFGINLPSDYLWFISNYGEAFVPHEVGFKPKETNPWLSKHGLNEVNLFYSGERNSEHSVLQIKNRLRDQIKDKFLPIAESSGGNQICLWLGSEGLGSVYFWDHQGKVGEDLFLIADSFRDFIESFEEVPEQSSEEKPKIVNSRISDDF